MTKPFVPAGTKSHYAPDRPIAVQHLRLDVDLDFAAQAIGGRATLSLAVRAPEITAVQLNAVDMEIKATLVDGQPPPRVDYDGQHLRLTLPRPFRRDERLTVAIDYRAVPRRGLYFLAPDEHTPDRPVQCWTQGQDEDARHYVPCVDAPVEKTTTEVVCTAPRGRVVISNGDLIESKDIDGGRTRWHYRLDVPQPSYLLTLVCGTLSEQRERAPETGVDVYYYGPPGRDEDVKRSLGKTPAIVDFFSRTFGVRYPHRRYSQVMVADFIFGGMENTTATTLTDQALLDPRAAIDHDVDSLVAHELAHQWWGDLLTCREWPEGWLNEGFATYSEFLWREHDKGRDEADCAGLDDLDSYLNEADRYQRPIVCRQYQQPIDLFDAHLYEKGGRVLHMLRHELGDEAFFRTLKVYAERHAHGSVETRDLSRAVEEACGRNADPFFDQWVRRPGHVELEASWEWDADRKLGTLHLKQTQRPDEPAYTFPARVRFEVGGATTDHTVNVRERSHAFEFRLGDAPTQVVFDPGGVLLKTIKFEKPRPLWIRQLEAAPLAVDRVLAARALGDAGEPAAVVALRKSLESDPFWAVRAAAATALGHTRRRDARDALLAARNDKTPKVRRAVAAALGEFIGDETVADALVSWLEAGDPSGFVEGTCALALGRTRSRRALDVLPGLFSRAVFQDFIRSRAIDGLGESGHEAAIELASAAYSLSMPFQARRAAVNAVAKLAEGTPHTRRARELGEHVLDDPDFRVRFDAAAALSRLGDAKALSALERARARELDGRARRRFDLAIEALREGTRPIDETRRLRDELNALRGESVQLRERLEKLEREAKTAKPGTTGSGGKGKPPAAPRPPRRPRPPARRTSKPARRR